MGGVTDTWHSAWPPTHSHWSRRCPLRSHRGHLRTGPQPYRAPQPILLAAAAVSLTCWSGRVGRMHKPLVGWLPHPQDKACVAAAGSPLPPGLPSPSWGWSLHAPQGLCTPTPSRLDWLSLPSRGAKSCLRTSLHDAAPMVHAPASVGPLWSPSVAGGSRRHSADDPVSIPKAADCTAPRVTSRGQSRISQGWATRGGAARARPGRSGSGSPAGLGC